MHHEALTFLEINCWVLTQKPSTEAGVVWTPEPGWSELVAHYSCWRSQTQVCHLPSTRPKPMATSGAKPKHHTLLDPVKQPKDWVRAYARRMRESTQLVAGVPLFVPGMCRRAPCNLCTAAGQETGCRFLTSHSPIQEIGVMNPPPSHSTLHHNDSLPSEGLKDCWDIRETKKEKTLALSKALQSCSKWAWGLIAWCVTLPRTFRGVWPTWCGLRRRRMTCRSCC